MTRGLPRTWPRWTPAVVLVAVVAAVSGYATLARPGTTPVPDAGPAVAPQSCLTPYMAGDESSTGTRPRSGVRARPAPGWTGSWSTAQQRLTTAPFVAAPGSLVASSFGAGYAGRTVRMLVHPTVGGDRVRVRLANTFGDRPLRIDAAGIGLAVSGQSAALAPAPGVQRRLTFGGSARGTVPPGRRLVSDPVTMPVRFGDTLAVDLYVAPGPAPVVTGHARSVQASFSAAGDRVGEQTGAGFDEPLTSWFWLDSIDVRAGRGARSVVALGDSLTDGTYTTTGANRRWTDRLADRLQLDRTRPVGVLNKGIGGNRVVTANLTCATPSASGLDRFGRDVLSQTEVRTVVIALGVNDVAVGTPGPRVVEGLRTLAARAHGRGLRVVVATVTPFHCDGGCLDAKREAARQQVNAWIRTTPDVDAVADFDLAVRDPRQPVRLRAEYDLGDHIHLNDAGQAALANAVPLQSL